MLKRLAGIFDNVVIDLVMKKYYKDVMLWVRGSLEFDDVIEETRFMKGDGETLAMVLLWSYGNFEIKEISALSGRSVSTVLNRLKKGRELLIRKDRIANQRFRKLYSGYRRMHIKLMERYFGLDFENDYRKSELDFVKVTDAFVYMKLDGKEIRLSIDQLRGMTHLADMVYSTRKGAILRKLDLLEV